MFFDASLASSAFPSEKQGAPRGIPLSVLSKEKVRQGCSLVFLGRSLVRSISLLDIRFPCSNVKNPAWFYGFGVYLGENSMKSPLTRGGGRCFRAVFPKLFQASIIVFFVPLRCFASTSMMLESFANLGQYDYVTSVQMIDIFYEILRARCWIIKEIRFVMRLKVIIGIIRELRFLIITSLWKRFVLFDIFFMWVIRRGKNNEISYKYWRIIIISSEIKNNSLLDINS